MGDKPFCKAEEQLQTVLLWKSLERDQIINFCG